MPGEPAKTPGEFDLIARWFAPLSVGAPGAFNLTDDAATLATDGALVVSVDAVVEGVHFLPDDPLDTVARKALRVNLSDLAAKGAEPVGWLLTLAWPKDRPTDAIGQLAAGFAADVAEFGVPLLGGDTVATPGPVMLSVTVLGRPGPRGMVRRAGARVGDVVCVTGTIGDGFLGLKAARGGLDGLGIVDRDWLADRYRLPRPRLGCAGMIAAHATAALDVSDGLVADSGHLARASGVALVLDGAAVPLSEPTARWWAGQSDRHAALAALLSGGDDYEVLFTLDPADVAKVQAASPVPFTVIGRCEAGAGVRVLLDGAVLPVPAGGWQHFGG